MAALYQLDVIPENIVGTSLPVKIYISPANALHALDWVGVYPSSTPTAPGLSLSRWMYLGQGKKNIKNNTVTIDITIPVGKLPNHGGFFEVRVHRKNGYSVENKSLVHFLQQPMSRFKRWAFFFSLVALVAVFQEILNNKGTCTYLDPDKHTDKIDDWGYNATYDLNAYLVANRDVAAACQALSSLFLDGSMLLLLLWGALKRSTVRPFLSLVLFMTFRFIAQIAATIPCAPGYIWPSGKLFGFAIPTIFVDYHPANDMFFSGHTGTLVVAGIQFYTMNFMFVAAIHFLFALPFVATLVVAFRVHRGIDVLAAIFAAIAACSVAENIADPIDRALQETKKAKVFKK
jgi:hypothetical protein